MKRARNKSISNANGWESRIMIGSLRHQHFLFSSSISYFWYGLCLWVYTVVMTLKISSHRSLSIQYFLKKVLITKLRSANTVETRQYHKASKALLVLIPLLGITYLIVIYGPESGVQSHIFAILQALLLSIQVSHTSAQKSFTFKRDNGTFDSKFISFSTLQSKLKGFSVALFYCFFNTEVRQAVKHRLNRWRDRRNLSSGSSIRSRRYTMSRDYSPKSRTESIRWVNAEMEKLVNSSSKYLSFESWSLEIIDFL